MQLFRKWRVLNRFSQFQTRQINFFQVPGQQLKPTDLGRYVDHLNRCMCEHTKFLVEPVRELKNLILEDSVLRMYFEGALKAIPYGRVLYGYNLDRTMDILNTAVVSPPSPANAQITGVPIYSLFIDLLDSRWGQGFFASQRVNTIFGKIFNRYSAMLQSKESRQFMNQSANGWFSPELQKKVDYENYQIFDKSRQDLGYKTWNDWFTRDFKQQYIDQVLKPNLDENIIVNNSQSYPLGPPATNVKLTDEFWLKEAKYSVTDMLDAKKFALQNDVLRSFDGATVYQGFLDPWCYHRWRSPVSGTIERAYKTSGAYYLENPSLESSPQDRGKVQQNYINSQPFLAATSVRQIYLINTHNPMIGRVAVIEIGMCEVSSCNSTVLEGQRIKKGDQLGYFQFGGSSHAMIFENKAKLCFNSAISQPDAANNSYAKQEVCSNLATVTS